MKKLTVAIVGRPNVGKSTFFNRVSGKRLSIVENIPGVTRDRVYASADWNGVNFSMIDTAGLEFSANEEIGKTVLRQAKMAIDFADVILFFVDGKIGLTAGDEEVAQFLRKSGKKIVLAVNKLDNNEIENTYEFYSLNLGDPFPISSEHGTGIGDLLDEVVKGYEKSDEEENSNEIKIAIVGKPNAGKSSLTNVLVGQERMVVTDIAGTTRDAIDTPIRVDGQDYILIDTAGMRRQSQVEQGSIESYSVIRAINAIKSCDVALLIVDATQGLTDQDLKIASLINGEGKPSVIIINKWDLIEKDDKTMNKFIKDLEYELDFMSYFKAIFISCKSGRRIGEVMKEAKLVYDNSCRRVPMGVLNEIISDAVGSVPPPSVSGRRPKIIYSTQYGTKPPSFNVFCSDANLIQNSYSRYIENKIRDAFNFVGCPIKISFINKGEKED